MDVCREKEEIGCRCIINNRDRGIAQNSKVHSMRIFMVSILIPVNSFIT